MAEVAKAAARQLPKGFKLGQKEVFLPNHVITFLRKEHLPPNEACFKVPLRFTKFDLRDYLWNLYNVEVTKVRSYVKQQPLTQKNSYSRSWYRPQPLKIMTVELSQPFTWPELPEDKTPWSNQLWQMREDLMEKRNQEHIQRQRFELPMRSKEPLSKERQQLADLAKQIASGEVKWENDVVLDPKWEKILKDGDKREVKKAVEKVEDELSR
ncbi:Fc.00g091400.m01.CDS01 [Cosmosporella sp. VM-42]